MKIMFVLVSCLLAVSLSILAAVYASGNLSFRAHAPVIQEQPESASRTETRKERAHASAFAGQAQMVDDLVRELKAQIEKNRKMEEELNTQQGEFEQKQQQMKLLEQKLAVLRDEVSRKIVQISDNEEGNFKKLAEMYGKMDPESASRLLQKTEPDRAAKIISLIGDRQAAAIMGASVTMGESAAGLAAEWTDALRRLNNEKKARL